MIVDLTGVTWRKSVRSQQSGSCVEFAVLPGVTAVRDSKRPQTGHLLATQVEWATFLTAVKAGHFDL
jgi:hypothetical protein